MIRKKTLTFLLLIVALSCSAQNSRRALLVGVAHYPEGSGWRTIHSDNDVRLLKSVLSQTFAIDTLVDKGATYKNITKALTKLARTSEKGDTVLLSFSCHGQQMWLSDEPDSLDEALVPYDAKFKYSDSYKGERHLRDDTLSFYVNRIRKSVGSEGLVIVLLDACHSGNSFKASESTDTNYRGVYDIFGPANETPKHERDSIKDYVPIERMEGNTAEVIYMSACQDCQNNREFFDKDKNLWYGTLVYAFSKAYTTLGLSDETTLLAKIQSQIVNTSPQRPEFAVSNPELIPTVEAPTDDTTGYGPDGDGNGFLRCWVLVVAISIIISIVVIVIVRKNGRRNQ